MTAATDTFASRVRRAAALVEQVEELLDGPGPVGFMQIRRRRCAVEGIDSLAAKLDSLSASLREDETP